MTPPLYEAPASTALHGRRRSPKTFSSASSTLAMDRFLTSVLPRDFVLFLFLMLYAGSWLPILQGQVIRDQPVNLVVQIDGQLKVKRPGWAVYAPVVFGTNLHAGDLLDLDKSSSAKVVCSDLTLHEIPSGIAGVPCPVSRVVLKKIDGTLINTTRGWPGDDSSPVVLSPRNTKLLTTHPTLRWTPVKGATAYKVFVRGKNLQWYTVVTSATELVYPKEAPELQSGIPYKLIVEADEGRSGGEPGLGPSFSLLNSNDKKAVLQEQKLIENLGLPEGTTQFLIAHLYADRGLYAEAIERLEGVSQKFRMAAVRKLLGDLHVDTGLPRQAEADYLNSLELARAENDEEGQMLLHKALASIYANALDNKEMASQHLDATLDLARKLGDASIANQAGKQLAELKSASHAK